LAYLRLAAKAYLSGCHNVPYSGGPRLYLKLLDKPEKLVSSNGNAHSVTARDVEKNVFALTPGLDLVQSRRLSGDP